MAMDNEVRIGGMNSAGRIGGAIHAAPDHRHDAVSDRAIAAV